MDAEKKPFDQWSKRKKVKYFAALGDLFGDTRETTSQPNWKGKETPHTVSVSCRIHIDACSKEEKLHD